jgi:hypothetical protein
MHRLLFALLIMLALIACQRDKPGKDILPPEALVPVLVDIHLLNSIQSSHAFRTIARDADSIDTHGYIFDKHGVTSIEFDSSIAWYSRHPDLFTEIYDEVVMQLTLISDSINANPE